MPRTSVNLGTSASLDEMKGHGWEPSEQATVYDDAPEPERQVSCVDTMRLLQEINRANPLALNVLMDSAIDRMTRRQTATHLRVTERTIESRRAWLRQHHPALAACLNTPPPDVRLAEPLGSDHPAPASWVNTPPYRPR
jgi:hypothetical protein